MSIQLEVAFDDVSVEQALAILEASNKEIDIIEDGTLFLLKDGLNPLKIIRSLYPDKVILADPKIMDAPETIASYCYNAGANIVTCMGNANEKTIRKVIETSKRYNGKVFLDLLDVENISGKLEWFDNLGADYLCIHASKTNPDLPFEEFVYAKKVIKKSKLAIAGGIDTKNIRSVCAMRPDVIVVGSCIYKAEHPENVIHTLKEAMM